MIVVGSCGSSQLVLEQLLVTEDPGADHVDLCLAHLDESKFAVNGPGTRHFVAVPQALQQCEVLPSQVLCNAVFGDPELSNLRGRGLWHGVLLVPKHHVPHVL